MLFVVGARVVQNEDEHTASPLRAVRLVTVEHKTAGRTRGTVSESSDPRANSFRLSIPYPCTNTLLGREGREGQVHVGSESDKAITGAPSQSSKKVKC